MADMGGEVTPMVKNRLVGSAYYGGTLFQFIGNDLRQEFGVATEG